MRIVHSLLMLLLLSSITYAQKSSKPGCPIQDLAIEAALGDTLAQYNLGVEFFRGDRVRRDYAKAAKLWRSASDAGDVAAANNLGFLKYYGRPGVPQDYVEGLRLWRLAAERGFAESQVHLSQAYSDGRYLEVDLLEAYAWATAGRHNAHNATEMIDNRKVGDAVTRDAEEVLTYVRKNLSPTEIAKAERKAAEYIEKFARR
jgi:uncharacterized protein